MKGAVVDTCLLLSSILLPFFFPSGHAKKKKKGREGLEEEKEVGKKKRGRRKIFTMSLSELSCFSFPQEAPCFFPPNERPPAMVLYGTFAS